MNRGKIFFDEKGLVPLVVQDAETKQVLSLFYADRGALQKMRETGFVWRYSRSKKKLLKKGGTSGNLQEIVEIRPDCDSDALLVLVKQAGEGACHFQQWSCFGGEKTRSWGVLDGLVQVISERKKNSVNNSYVSSIVGKPRKVGSKLVEEALELREALLQKPGEEVVWEAADLLFFILVALASRGIDAQLVLGELKRRRKEKMKTREKMESNGKRKA